jgi:hypothetical protein
LCDLLGADTEILYAEFGVYKGYSIEFFARKLSNPSTILVGFDSFLGLPEDWGSLKKGHFSTEGQVPPLNDKRITFKAGLFQDTVRSFFKKDNFPKTIVPLFHFDADLYSSTLFCLFAVEESFDEFLCIFDEFSGEECRALYNFGQATRANIEFIGVATGDGDLPIHVLCRVRSKLAAQVGNQASRALSKGE